MTDVHELRIPFVSAEVTIRGRLNDGRFARLRIPQLRIADPDDFRFRDTIETEEVTAGLGDEISYALYEHHTLMLDIEGVPVRGDMERPSHYFTFEILPDEEDTDG